MDKFQTTEALINQYIFFDADKFCNEINNIFYDIQKEIANGDVDNEKIVLLVRYAETCIKNWKLQCHTIKSCVSQKEEEDILNISERLQQDQDTINCLEEKLEKYQEWTKIHQNDKGRELEGIISEYEILKDLVKQKRIECKELLISFEEAPRRKMRELEGSLHRIEEEFHQISFEQFGYRLQHLMKKYPNSEKLEELLTNSKRVYSAKEELRDEFKKMRDICKKNKKAQKRKRKLIGILIAVLLIAGMIASAEIYGKSQREQETIGSVSE